MKRYTDSRRERGMNLFYLEIAVEKLNSLFDLSREIDRRLKKIPKLKMTCHLTHEDKSNASRKEREILRMASRELVRKIAREKRRAFDYRIT
jgi:hypothetical protein